MSFDRLEPEATAVVFFDLLNKWVRPDAERERELQPVIDRCVQLRNAANDLGMAVVCVRPDHRSDGRDSAKLYSDTGPRLEPWTDPENEYFGRETRPISGTWDTQIIDELAPGPGDYLVLKHRWNAFHQTHLELSLRTRRIDTIVLCGGTIQIGIASTAYAARDLDFNIVVARDCCTSHDPVAADLFMTRVFPFMSRVRSAEQILDMLGA